jgi:rhodanese-related sulfurtransferase
MKTLVLLCTAILFSIGGYAQQSRNVNEISADSAKRSIENGKATIIDVRTPEEFKEGHISGATNIDYQDKDFESKISSLDKDKQYILYCRSGNRSGKALEIMKQKGFNASNLEGGIMKWEAEGLPLEK